MLLTKKRKRNSTENANKLYDDAIGYLEDAQKTLSNEEEDYISEASASLSYAMDSALAAKEMYENIANESLEQEEKQRAQNDAAITQSILVADIKWFQKRVQAESLKLEAQNAKELGDKAQVALVAFRELRDELKLAYSSASPQEKALIKERAKDIKENINFLKELEHTIVPPAPIQTTPERSAVSSINSLFASPITSPSNVMTHLHCLDNIHSLEEVTLFDGVSAIEKLQKLKDIFVNIKNAYLRRLDESIMENRTGEALNQLSFLFNVFHEKLLPWSIKHCKTKEDFKLVKEVYHITVNTAESRNTFRQMTQSASPVRILKISDENVRNFNSLNDRYATFSPARALINRGYLGGESSSSRAAAEQELGSSKQPSFSSTKL